LLSGSTTVKGRTVDVDVNYNDLMDLIRHSEIPKDLFALMGYFEARKGRLSFFSDLVYLKVGLNGSMTRSRGVDALNATVGASAGLKYEMFIAEFAAAYEVTRWGSTGMSGSGTAIDIFGGVRAWWQRADASLALAGTINVGDLALNAGGCPLDVFAPAGRHRRRRECVPLVRARREAPETSAGRGLLRAPETAAGVPETHHEAAHVSRHRPCRRRKS
jgi:hypothetical protein